MTRPWEIYLVHHTHVDIGYTEPQETIFRKHAEYIAQALDYCAATDRLPLGERFCWTCETAWTVKVFLQRYPERAEEFFRRAREGRVEITGIYVQLTDLLGKRLLEHALDYSVELGRKHGFAVVTAMNDDVNGWAWGLPKMLADRGIQYFDTAINETRSLAVRPRPRPFYWASPDAGRVLMWHGNGYLHGNAMGFDGPDAERYVVNYLASLEASGYLHNVVAVRIHGENHDNAPPGLWISKMVHEWNKKHDFLKLRICTAKDWFKHIEQHWPESILEKRAGWPDWWADGNGSALYESALIRSTQAKLETIETLESLGNKSDRALLESARESAMLFCEHTWGAWCSTDDPDCLETKTQWNVKAGFAYAAANVANSLLEDLLRGHARKTASASGIIVFNPSSMARSDLVEVVVPDTVLGADPNAQVMNKEITGPGIEFYLVDIKTNQKITGQRKPAIITSARRPAQTFRFMASNVPPLGLKEYRIEKGRIIDSFTSHATIQRRSACGPAAATERDGRLTNLTMENKFYRLCLDQRTGGIASLIDIASEREMVNSEIYTLNQFIYETIDSPEGRERLCTWRGIRRDVPFRRTTPPVSMIRKTIHPHGAFLTIESHVENSPFLSSKITLYDDLPRIDIVNTLIKYPVRNAEAVYHAFPIMARPAVVYLDVTGAVMRPGIDQVAGTATDWHSIQAYFAVGDENRTMVVASPDVPLVQVNGINTGKWQETLPAHNGTVMSWVMNNYWFTNFPAEQGGKFVYRYSLAVFSGAFDRERAENFAQSIRQPLIGMII